MKTRYKYIEFLPSSGEWTCVNRTSADPLGTVCWYPRWRTHVFQPMGDVEFSPDCLRDIADFLEQVNAARKVKP